MQYIHDTDWQDFFKAFPGSEGWLTGRALINERRYLQNTRRNEWQEGRLNDLNEWHKISENIKNGRLEP